MQEMMNAIESGEVEKVTELLEQDGMQDTLKGINSETGETILSSAAKVGNVDIVKALIGAGLELAEGEVESLSDYITSEISEAFKGILPPMDLPPSLSLPLPLPIQQGPQQEQGEFEENLDSLFPINLPPVQQVLQEREEVEEVTTFEEEPTVSPPIRSVPVHPKNNKEVLEAANKAAIAEFAKNPDGITSGARNFITGVRLAKKEGAQYTPMNIDGYKEWEILTRSGELAKMNLAAISEFKKVFDDMIGVEGLKVSGYDKLLQEIDALNKVFEKEKTGLGSGVSATEVQIRLNRIQFMMGQVYANSPAARQNVSIKTFIDNVDMSAKVMLEQLGMQGDLLMSKEQLVSQPKYIHQPIERAAAAGKLTRVNAVRDEDKSYLKAISDFKNEFNSLIGDRGRKSPEYEALSHEMSALHAHFNTGLPGTVAFSRVTQMHLNNIQSLMGQFYANNPDVQQHLSIKGFMDGVDKISKDTVSKLTTSAIQPLISYMGLVLEPIAHAVATGKMEQHDSELKNAEDFRYLQSCHKTTHGQLREDVEESIDKFNMLDQFKLAQVIKDDPDKVVRYLQASIDLVASKDKRAPAREEAITAVAKILDTFSSNDTKKNMQYIVDKLNGVEKERTGWEYIAAPFVDAMNSLKKGVEAITGYDDIEDALDEIGELYRVYGPLFKGEDIKPTVSTSFASKLLKGRRGDEIDKDAPLFAKEIKEIRATIDTLIGDNGRNSKEYTALLNAIDTLGKENLQFKDAFQDKLNNVSQAIANLYVSNMAVQQHVSLREFSEGVANGVQVLVDRVNNVHKLDVVGAEIQSNTKHILIKTIAEQPIENLNSHASDASKIDAHKYLAAQSIMIPEVSKAQKKFEAQDNFKLAELINKDPERVMRVMEEMLKQGVLLPKFAGQEGDVEKVATVLSYLSSDKTKNKMEMILGGLDDKVEKKAVGTAEQAIELFARAILAIEKGINWLTGFDKEVESAFTELSNIVVMQHDVIAKYEQDANRSASEGRGVIESEKKEGVKSFVERISKPSVGGPEIS